MSASRSDPSATLAAVDHLLARARALGADAADCACAESQSLSVGVRLDTLEDVERSESRVAGLRCMIGQRQAGATTSDLSPAALDVLAERVIAMTRAAAEDPWCGLPAANAMAAPGGDLGLRDATVPDIAAMETMAREAERAALAVAGVTNSSGSGASWGSSGITYGNSHGFRGSYGGTNWSVGLSVLAGADGAMERDYDYDSARFVSRLKDPAAIGASAGQRVVARLGARKLQSQTAPVVFHNRIAPSLMGFLIGAISGAAVARGVSFLRNHLGKPVFAPGVNVVDDPTVMGGWASRTFDGEGSPVQRRAIIEDGVLTTWLLNHASARQLGMTTTGHASADPGRPPGTRPSNLTLMPGTRDMAGLMADAGSGLLVMETFSPSFNANTGDYSVGVSGHWFENGVIVHPVHETTIAGSMADMFARLVPGSDLYGKGAVDAPSVLVDAMTLAGV